MDVVINSNCDAIPEGSRILVSQGSGLLNFLKCLGYDAQKPPVADLLSIYHNLKNQNLEYGNWLVISPIYWQATHNDALILAVGEELDLSPTEMDHCYQLFSKHLAAEGMSLYFHNADYWLLNADNLPELKAKPVYQLVNRSFMPELEQLDTSMFWQKFITESQMFFAAEANASDLNGVWVWGGGAKVKKGALSICADETFYNMASICSSNVSLYSPQIELSHFSIILLNSQELLSESQKKEITKKNVNWFWNNAAYTSNHSNWLTRLWRTLIHAH